MTAKDGTVQRLLRALIDEGPMTMQDMVRLTGKPKSSIHPILCKMLRPTKRPVYPKRIYIYQWVYDQEGQKRYPRPMYAIGDRPDAPRPVADPKANDKRRRDKRRVMRTTNSVFNLAALSRVQWHKQCVNDPSTAQRA